MSGLTNSRIDQLPEGNPTIGDFLVYRDMVNGVTKRTLADQFLPSPTTTNYEWLPDNDPGYALDEVVTYAGKWWQSLIDDNLNIIPGTDPTKWIEISKSNGNYTLWVAGVFTEDNVFVTREKNGRMHQFMLDPDEPRPFVSSDFDTEFEEGKWILVSALSVNDNVAVIPISAASLQTCGSVPVELIALIADKFPSVNKVAASFKTGVTEFDFASDIVLKTVAGDVQYLIPFGEFNTLADSQFDLIKQGQKQVDGVAYVLTTEDASDATQGDGTLIITIYYTDINKNV